MDKSFLSVLSDYDVEPTESDDLFFLRRSAPDADGYGDGYVFEIGEGGGTCYLRENDSIKLVDGRLLYRYHSRPVADFYAPEILADFLRGLIDK